MEKPKSKETRKVKTPQLTVAGQLAMPERLLPWERDLLAVLIEAVDGSGQREKKDEIEVP